MLLYAVFVAGIVFLVVKASSQKFDLVTKDYYEQELQYQNVIDQSENAAKLSEPVIVKQKESALMVSFPREMKDRPKKINFYLYCPADSKKRFYQEV